jgi:hypothetical protein
MVRANIAKASANKRRQCGGKANEERKSIVEEGNC